MMQHRVNELRMKAAASLDLYPLFKVNAAGARETDRQFREVERDIHYATLDAIGEAASKVEPRDIENVLMRIGYAAYLLDRLYDYAHRGIEIDGVIGEIDKLISGSARALVQIHGVDVEETVLDFHLPKLGARQ